MELRQTCGKKVIKISLMQICKYNFLLEQFSLFSVVQFPNEECTSTSSSTTTGTCYTSSECTSRSGSASGTCAAGFGVCCVSSTSTCGSTVSTNITYIRHTVVHSVKILASDREALRAFACVVMVFMHRKDYHPSDLFLQHTHALHYPTQNVYCSELYIM